MRGEVGILAQNFLIRAIAHRMEAESCFRSRIGRANGAGGVHEKEAGGHVARNFLGEALGFLRSFLCQSVQARQFLFLAAELFDHALHGRGHESGGIVRTGLGSLPVIVRGRGSAAKIFSNQDHHRHDGHEKKYGGQARIEKSCWGQGGGRNWQRAFHVEIDIPIITGAGAATGTRLEPACRKTPPAALPCPGNVPNGSS